MILQKNVRKVALRFIAGLSGKEPKCRIKVRVESNLLIGSNDSLIINQKIYSDCSSKFLGLFED